MKVYWIALYKKIDSQENIKKYGAKVTDIIKSYGGVPLVRGGNLNTLEGETYPRTVIWEFPSYEKAQEWYKSEEYKPIKKIRLDNALSNGIIIKGE